MIRPSCIFMLSIVLGLSLQAQDAQQAQNLIHKVSNKLQSYKSVQADFSFTLFNEEAGLKDTHDGSLVLQSSKYRLQLMGILAICNGETLWSINDESKEVYLMDPEENELFSPEEIFNLVEVDFNYNWIKQSGNLVTIDLLPKDAEGGYQKIQMVIDQSRDQIKQATYYSDDGNQYIIVIKSMLADPLVDDSFFVFDKGKFPGYSVYDMR